MHDARVEVHVGVEFAGDEIFVFQCNFFQSHGQFEQGIVFQPEFLEDFFAGLLHQFGARIVVLVDAVAKTHQLDAGVFVLDLLHEFANLGDAPHFLDVFQHVQTGFVGSTMCRPP